MSGQGGDEGLLALDAWRRRVLEEVEKVLVGQHEVIDMLLVGLLARGHVLLEGVPGTAKTLAVRALASALDVAFGRIQFTPDLMPSDVVGVHVFDMQRGTFELTRGPVFTELLLADEINRAPAKTQSALLEAMQERQVTIDGRSYPLSPWFTVFATQNPVEQEGTYPLPEAQLDRFLLRVRMGYPSEEEEERILERAGGDVCAPDPSTRGIRPVVARERLEVIRSLVGSVHVEPPVRRYVRDLVRATRRSPLVQFGAGPRAAVHLLVASRWHAALRGRPFVSPDDVVAMLEPVLAHRLILPPEVELDGMRPEDALERLLTEVEVPR